MTAFRRLFAVPGLPPIPARWADEQLTVRTGVRVTSARPERVVATMPVDGNRQPYGRLHGGANAVLAETVGSIAAELNAGPGRQAYGRELSCTHHRPATAGVVTAVCTPVDVGDAASTFAIEITDERGRVTCTATLSCVVRRQRHAPPPE